MKEDKAVEMGVLKSAELQSSYTFDTLVYGCICYAVHFVLCIYSAFLNFLTYTFRLSESIVGVVFCSEYLKMPSAVITMSLQCIILHMFLCLFLPRPQMCYWLNVLAVLLKPHICIYYHY